MDTYSEWNKCQWDKETTTSAAEFGHLECMEYLQFLKQLDNLEERLEKDNLINVI